MLPVSYWLGSRVVKRRVATEYVLIDFENVQPKNLELLKQHPFKVFVFCGANQSKVPLNVASAIQPLGANVEYVTMSGSGRNALDFHIAFYLGELAARDPEAVFHVISRDKGFDPLIHHLRERQISVRREDDLAEIPVLRMAETTSHNEKLKAILKNLEDRGPARPRRVKTLGNTILALFTNKLDESEVQSLIAELEECRYISVSDGRVSYPSG